MNDVTVQQVKDFALAGLKLMRLPVTVFTEFKDTLPYCAMVEKAGPHFILRMNLKAVAVDKKNWKSVIAHELKHIEQMYSGKLYDFNGLVFWCGEDWTNEAFAAHVMLSTGITDAYYKKLPWEFEAFEMQDALAEQIQSSMMMRF
jgi:hypothetical protein